MWAFLAGLFLGVIVGFLAFAVMSVAADEIKGDGKK